MSERLTPTAARPSSGLPAWLAITLGGVVAAALASLRQVGSGECGGGQPRHPATGWVKAIEDET